MKKLMLGNAAVAQGAYEAGVKVVSSYPGTPSTEITENIVKYDEIYAVHVKPCTMKSKFQQYDLSDLTGLDVIQ